MPKTGASVGILGSTFSQKSRLMRHCSTMLPQWRIAPTEQIPTKPISHAGGFDENTQCLKQKPLWAASSIPDRIHLLQTEPFIKSEY